jgi:hypothetical protein
MKKQGSGCGLHPDPEKHVDAVDPYPDPENSLRIGYGCADPCCLLMFNCSHFFEETSVADIWLFGVGPDPDTRLLLMDYDPDPGIFVIEL